MNEQEYQAIIDTPIGQAEIIGDENGLRSVSVLEQESQLSDRIPVSLQPCVDQLNQYFHGVRKDFDLKLNPRGTQFQKQIWQLLRQIPYGTTTTYQEQAQRFGDLKAIRAVASANGKNPLWIIVPCHRVIGKDGSLTGYAGGLWRKRWLLEHENPPKQTSLF